MTEPSTNECEHFPPMPAATAPLWIGALGTPAIWSAQLVIVYIIAPRFDQPPRATICHVVAFVSLLLVAAFGLICLRYRSAADNRVHFFGTLGMCSAVLYFVASIAQGIASFLLGLSIF